jgi:hypothetical protein
MRVTRGFWLAFCVIVVIALMACLELLWIATMGNI